MKQSDFFVFVYVFTLVMKSSSLLERHQNKCIELKHYKDQGTGPPTRYTYRSFYDISF